MYFLIGIGPNAVLYVQAILAKIRYRPFSTCTLPGLPGLKGYTIIASLLIIW